MKLKKTAVLLGVCAFLSACGCSKNEETAKNEIVVWTATGTEKLLRDTDYSARYDEKTLKIKAFKNEYESAQIMISASEESEYSVSAGALTNASGDVLSASAFTLYHEKYIKVTELRDQNSPTKEGHYPDALIPLDKAQEYGENKISGKNQGVWVTLKVPKGQAAGEYAGSFTVTAAGEEFSVPVSVTVYDYELSDEVHSKSSFSVGYEYLGWGELDTTAKMQEAYYEALLEYRLSGQQLPGNELVYVLPEGEALKTFLAYAEKYTKDVRCTSFNLPFTMATAMYEGKEIKSVDFEKFAVLLEEMAKYSAKHGINLFEKASTYFIFFDEYDNNGTTDVANYNLNKAVETCRETASRLSETLVCENAELRAQILSGVEKIKHKVVGNLTDGLQAEAAVSVPLISKYHTEEGRKMYSDFAEKCYGDEAELWCYTCLEPRTPNPTYHIEDVLASSRLMGWMMYDYNIVGNLYWETALYAWRQSAFGDYQLQDYYDTSARYPNVNGDGFLFYPGRDYGVYGPIGTLRLHSIRDGNEDYDLAYALEAAYKQYGVSESHFNELYHYLTADLYTGTQVRIRDGLTDYISKSRDLLAGLLELAYNADTAIEEIRQADGETIATLSAPKDVTLEANGNALTPVSSSGDRNVYTAKVTMNQKTNALSVAASKGGKTWRATIDLGGESSVINAATLKDKAKVLSGGTAEVVQIDGENALQLTYNAGDKRIAEIEATSLNITEEKNTVFINVYSEAEEDLKLQILSKCENSGNKYVPSKEVTLKKGWNRIEISVMAFNCNRFGKLTGLRFNFDGASAEMKIAIGKIEIGG